MEVKDQAVLLVLLSRAAYLTVSTAARTYLSLQLADQLKLLIIVQPVDPPWLQLSELCPFRPPPQVKLLPHQVWLQPLPQVLRPLPHFFGPLGLLFFLLTLFHLDLPDDQCLLEQGLHGSSLLAPLLELLLPFGLDSAGEPPEEVGHPGAGGALVSKCILRLLLREGAFGGLARSWVLFELQDFTGSWLAGGSGLGWLWGELAALETWLLEGGGWEGVRVLNHSGIGWIEYNVLALLEQLADVH